MSERAKCPVCGHEDEVPAPLEFIIAQCSECRTRIGHGRAMPHLRTSLLDRHFVTLEATDPTNGSKVTLTIDHDLSHSLAMALLAISNPTRP